MFKIVPMLNPDGVVVGNYRCSMSGNDLNRKFDEPDLRLHPTVYNTKVMCEQIIHAYHRQGLSGDNLLFYVDMHAHSRRKNVFMFGPQVPVHSEKYLKMRVIPKLCAEETDMFRYHSCSFINEKAKEAAARISLYRQLGIWNCFTLEASFHGYYTRDRENFEFTPDGYEKMGERLVYALYEYCMVLEEDDRRKQLAKIEKQKGTTKGKEEDNKKGNKKTKGQEKPPTVQKAKTTATEKIATNKKPAHVVGQ